MKLYKCAVNTPFNNSILTYKSNEELMKGDLVDLPLGKRQVGGCILGPAEDLESLEQDKLKEIAGKSELGLSLSLEHLEFLEWVAKYYHYPFGQHIFDILPKPLKRPRDVLFKKGMGKPFDYDLTEEQKSAVDLISKKVESFSKFLIHGVTGSGKTTIYLSLIKSLAEKGKSSLFLVPEINLTPQFVKTFEAHVQARVLTYHSSMSSSEKKKVWDITQSDEPYILIGVRSSIFLPLKNVGLIVIDEEHDNSFKQEDRCTYHTRDIGIKLASLKNIPIILGSATPTMESLNSLKGTDNYIRLEKRPLNLEMPDIEIVDARISGNQEEDVWPFTQRSIEEIKTRLIDNEQVLVFVNRLGFASYVQCRSCGESFNCLNCSSSLKYFKTTNSLNCQFCDFKMPYPESCPSCGNMKLLQKGFGTEKLAEVLEATFPEKNVGRFDRGAVKTFNELKEVLDKFERREIDILVGTQMLSKGHNFKGVNLVVLLGIDSQLNFPDFRSNENAFQLITQTAGRPGRSEKKGKVLIQTLYPENKIFDDIKNYDHETFYENERQVRETLNYPPFSRLVAVYVNSRFQNKARDEMLKASGLIKHLVENHFTEVDILGPRPAIIEKRANNFTWTVLLRSNNLSHLHNTIENFQKNYKAPSGVSIKLDIDPLFLH